MSLIPPPQHQIITDFMEQISWKPDSWFYVQCYLLFLWHVFIELFYISHWILAVFYSGCKGWWYVRGLTIKLLLCACHSSSGQKPQYGLMTLAYQRFTVLLLLICGSFFLNGVSYCLSVFWCAITRMSELELEQRTNIKLLFILGKSGSEIREMLSAICKIWGFHGGDCDDDSWLFQLTAQSAATCSRCFLTHRFFYPEDGGDTILRYVGSHRNYMAPQPRKWLSSC
jgi:hypothetical protein